MKILISSLLLLGAGVGGLEVAGGGFDDAPPCSPEGCDVELERVDDDTCLVTCYDAAGGIVCQEEIDCSGPCDAPCDAPRSCAR
jgi:hypothetical protein